MIINAPADLRASLDQIRGPITLIRHVAALRPGEMTSPTASAKTAMRAIARRRLALREEIQAHDRELERLVRSKAPELIHSHAISTMTVAEMLIPVGDNPEPIRSEAALARLCGVCPIPASSGKTNRMRLNRGGNRQANKARPRARSCAASSNTLCARSTPRSADRSHLRLPLDEHRSFNSAVESFFKSLKAELAWRRDRQTRRYLEIALFECISGFYNPPQTLDLGLEIPRGLRTKGRTT